MGALFSLVIAQVCLGWAFSDNTTQFFGSFVLPIQMRLYFGFFSSDIFTCSKLLNAPLCLIFDSNGCCSTALAHFSNLSEKRKNENNFF